MGVSAATRRRRGGRSTSDAVVGHSASASEFFFIFFRNFFTSQAPSPSPHHRSSFRFLKTWAKTPRSTLVVSNFFFKQEMNKTTVKSYLSGSVTIWRLCIFGKLQAPRCFASAFTPICWCCIRWGPKPSYGVVVEFGIGSDLLLWWWEISWFNRDRKRVVVVFWNGFETRLCQWEIMNIHHVLEFFLLIFVIWSQEWRKRKCFSVCAAAIIILTPSDLSATVHLILFIPRM